MRWPWSKTKPPSDSGVFLVWSPEYGNCIEMEYEGNKRDAAEEAINRADSNIGKGINSNGCPECGAFGHGMDRHQ